MLVLNSPLALSVTLVLEEGNVLDSDVDVCASSRDPDELGIHGELFVSGCGLNAHLPSGGPKPGGQWGRRRHLGGRGCRGAPRWRPGARACLPCLPCLPHLPLPGWERKGTQEAKGGTKQRSRQPSVSRGDTDSDVPRQGSRFPRSRQWCACERRRGSSRGWRGWGWGKARPRRSGWAVGSGSVGGGDGGNGESGRAEAWRTKWSAICRDSLAVQDAPN